MFRNPLEERGGGVAKGDQIRIGCLTPAFLGAHKWAEMLRHPCILGDPQTKGDKIRIGCQTPAFWGAHKWEEMLRHPCVLGVHYRKGGKQKWPAPGSWENPIVGGP